MNKSCVIFPPFLMQAPTGDDYISNWSQHVHNPKYNYMKLQVMTYLNALMCFRGGVRCNNDAYISSGMQVFSDVLHARNHPKYQVILLTERANRSIAPPAVKNFMASIQSVSRSGHPKKGEGMDFQLENYNKASKVWLPKGVPSNEDWLRVFRLLDRLDGVSLMFNFVEV